MRILMKSAIFIYVFLFCVHFTGIYDSIRYLSGDMERNPVTRPNSSQNVAIDHGNLNSMTTNSFIKISLLKAYLSFNIFDVFCISETYLDLRTPFNDGNLSILGYELSRCDHPSNANVRSIIYFKTLLPNEILDIRFL